MDNAVTTSPGTRSNLPQPLTIGKAANILGECAWETLILAFLVQIFGSIAWGLVSGLLSAMTPSLPPGFASQGSESSWDFSFLNRHQFALIFGVLYVAKVAGRFAGYSRKREHRDRAAWAKRISRRLSEQWFSLVVINAFIAFGAVVAFKVMQQFSLTHWLWQMLLEGLRSLLQGLANLFSTGSDGTIKGLVKWYDANQFKFTFWLFYSAAICDDLGLPNYKALGRLLWRRFVSRKRRVVTAALDC